MDMILSKCTVRDWAPTDRESLVRCANHAAIAGNLRDGFPHPYSEADADRFLKFCASMSPCTYFAIVVDGEAVGGIGITLHSDVERVSAELGYWLGVPFWGRGIVTEVVMAVTEWALNTLPLTRVYAMPFARNLPSARVLEKAGFVLEGRLRRAIVKNGVIQDQLLYARVRED